MKKTFFVVLLVLFLILSSCGTDQSSSHGTGTDSNDLGEATGENTVDTTPNETEKDPQNEKITVVCDKEYTEEIDEEYLNTDVPVTHHKIRIPKLTLESENAAKFNGAIYRMHGVEPIYISENEYYSYDMVYNVDYIFEEYNGIFGIMITDYSSPITKYRSENYYGYYYDTVNDRELDYFEYLEALGVDYDELIQAANASVRSYNSDEWFELNGDFSAYEISAAVFSENKAYISVPLSESDKILIKFEQNFVEQTDKKYEVSIEDKLEIYYNTYKDLLNSSPERKIKDAFIVDYNGDGVPELVLDYNAYPYGREGDIVGIGDNNFRYGYSDPARGVGLCYDYGVLFYEGQVGLMEIEYASTGFDDHCVSVYRHGVEDRVLYCEIAVLPSGNFYAYKYGEDGEYVETSEAKCNELIKKYSDILETYKFSSATHGFRGPWELQKSMLGKY